MKKWAMIAVIVFGAACGDDELTSVMGDAQPSADASGPVLDAGSAEDATTLIDLGFVDAMPPGDSGTPTDSGVTIDAGISDAGFADAGVVTPCPFANYGPADRDRVVLVAHPLASSGGPNTDLRSLTLSAAGTLTDDGIRLDVGAEVSDIAFVPSGELALVAANDVTSAAEDHLVSLRIDGAGSVSIADRIRLPAADAREVHLSDDARTAYVVSLNVDESSGIHVVDVACDGTLTLLDTQFLNVILAQNLALVHGTSDAILIGGQAQFTMPPDGDDVRWLGPSGRGFAEVGAFDFWGNPNEPYASIDAYRIALSPDQTTLLVPNGSPFSSEGNQLVVFSVDVAQRSLTEINRITMGFDDARQALFSPDGATALVSLFMPNRVVVLTDLGNGLEVVGEITGIGLAEAMAQVERGTLAGRVLVSSTDVSGETNIAQLQITGPGMVSDLGQLNFVGGGSEDIPGAIAITP